MEVSELRSSMLSEIKRGKKIIAGLYEAVEAKEYDPEDLEYRKMIGSIKKAKRSLDTLEMNVVKINPV